VRVALTASEGLMIVERWQPAAVLIDIGLPDLNGYQVCRQIRALTGGERMLLIACTGWGQTDDRERAVAAGFDVHLVKPVDPDALVRLLAQDERVNAVD
jgi:CheY-like chemotaxis protein